MTQLLAAYLSHAGWVWIGLAAALLAAEVATGSGWLLWAAASAGVVALAEALWDLPPAIAVLLFAVLVIVSTLTARRYIPRRLSSPGEDINDNVARLLGHEGRVAEAFRDGRGRVLVDGKEWAAELEGGGDLDAGARVSVQGVAGAQLTVRPV
jgi:membrane protein implicated in regulation of membrane protease activity